jgi:ABC-2 type transport system permease protein
MLFASLFLFFGREAWHLVNLAQEPVYLLSGTYFPLSSLNHWLAAAASALPLTLGLDAVRQLLFDTGPSLGFLSVGTEIIALSVAGVVFLTAAVLALKFMERRAAESGTLTESRG